MMNTVELVRQLRSETGVGVLECRKALEQNSYNLQEALKTLREKAVMKAEKQKNRAALQGVIEAYSHSGGRIGVIVEINTETEFASRSEAIRRLAREVALQITAAAPLYVRDEDIPPQVLEEQAREAAESARLLGKPDPIIEKIVTGVLEKYKNRNVLLRQPYIRDENLTVADLLNGAISQVGENIIIRRFERWEIVPDSQEA